ncbi:hypothetical protein L0152_32775 [bacterium]|nr:hypothetical protein [bacterium]
MNRLLDCSVADSMDCNSNSSTLEDLFKKAILFSICNPGRYVHTEMQGIFKFMEALAGHAVLEKTVSHYDSQTTVQINLDDSRPPFRVKQAQCVNESRYLNLEKISAYLSSPEKILTDPRLHLSKNSLTQLVHHLGLRYEFSPSACCQTGRLNTGWDNIISSCGKSKIFPAAPFKPDNREWISAPAYELAPLADDRFSGNSTSSAAAQSVTGVAGSTSLLQSNNLTLDIWGQGKQSIRKAFQYPCEVHHIALKNHVLVEINRKDIAIGELIALSYSDAESRIGITRWRQSTPLADYFCYGIEWFSRCAGVDIYIDSKKICDYLFFHDCIDRTGHKSLLLPVGHYRCGSRVTITDSITTESYQLEKLLENNPDFCHYSLCPAYR